MGWKIKAATRRRLPPQYAKYGPDKSYRERVRTQAVHWKAHSRKHGNLALALFKTFPSYWYAGMFKVLADMTQLMSPLVIKALIRFSQQGECPLSSSLRSNLELTPSVCGKPRRRRQAEHWSRRRHGHRTLLPDADAVRVPAPVFLPLHGDRRSGSGGSHFSNIQAGSEAERGSTQPTSERQAYGLLVQRRELSSSFF